MASKSAGVSAKKQQELQTTYSNYKNTLQQLAQKIGDVEQEAEEHKFVRVYSIILSPRPCHHWTTFTSWLAWLRAPIALFLLGASPLAYRLDVSMNLTASFHELTAHPLMILITRLVLDTLEPLPGDRKCFRMINGVLVERTVKDVIPALKTNAEGLKKVLDDLVKQYKIKQDDLEKWKKKNNIQVVQS
ncbi:Prefoldin subunit-domain-containing protein [Hypoxylon sp. FL0890]|nr:Prefoldin subunit-domain-containing protein [Hypoxylon sp. FL0890]